MFRHLADIAPITTSHGVGQKRVLLSSNESGCSLTQIAVTELKAGETAVAHVHPDMQEGFYVLDGELEVDLDGKKTTCGKDTFVYVEKCTSHEMHALTDSRIMTIGCVIEASRNKLYPMLFKQNRKTLVWGTEDWTVSGVPNSESEVENGTWARYNLTEVISRRPEEILGRQTALKYNNQLPLLAKIIDAHQDLSIQVHPNDEMAKREHNKYNLKCGISLMLNLEHTSMQGLKNRLRRSSIKSALLIALLRMYSQSMRYTKAMCSISLLVVFTPSAEVLNWQRYSSHLMSPIASLTITVLDLMASHVSCIRNWLQKPSTILSILNTRHRMKKM